MGLLSILGKGIQAMVDEAMTAQSFKTGEMFEEYVREFIFIDRYYDVLERTHGYQRNSKDFVESSLKPDFRFRDRRTKREFYVEAKFRSGVHNGKIIWCTDKQLNRYQAYSAELPVFIILGRGEEPSFPKALSLMPLPATKYTGLFPSLLERFKIDVDEPISSNVLWKVSIT